MEFLEGIKGRRSVRKFKDEQVGHDVLGRVVEAAACAPSWKNAQIARYIVIEDTALKNEIADNCVMDFAFNAATIKNAPALVIVTYVAGRSGFERDGSFSTSKEDRWEMFDAGIASQTFCLAAHNEGLGSVIMGIFDDEKVAAAAGVPEGQKVAALIPIGYPDESPQMPKRKTADELLSFK
ncbi:MAG: nitroreductase family protein [Christensenella sp.]|uniref:nitroreductase family protein n=1 Tax=Christensenella sp. TaxID=1935934 RepID=UPI002B21C873|nr:nitroreductase family protein [Christensenella sp.]MEA5002079.1 nitroreductase family protein [Christensenella sp.]